MIQGFRDFRENSRIQGVIFNGVSEAMYSGLTKIAEKAGVVPLGCLPYSEDVRIGSRHLGLITAAELAGLRERLAKLGELAEKHIDLNGVLRLAACAPALSETPSSLPFVENTRVAVASDKAFCFMYRENIELMEAMGAEIVSFSPLADETLPKGIGGLYLCGGYPELYAEQISQNRAMLCEVKRAVENGMPTIAECGGFLYLHDMLDGVPMAGVIHAQAHRTDKLQRFGYATLSAGKDNLLCKAGESIRAHEFHYYESSNYGEGFTGKKAGNKREYPCIHAEDTLYAGFPHLYFPANPQFAISFIRKAAEYAASNH